MESSANLFQNTILDPYTTKYKGAIPYQKGDFSYDQSLAQNLKVTREISSTGTTDLSISVSDNRDLPKLITSRSLEWTERAKDPESKFNTLLLDCQEYSSISVDPTLDKAIKSLENDIENDIEKTSLLDFYGGQKEHKNNQCINEKLGKKDPNQQEINELLKSFRENPTMNMYNELLHETLLPDIEKLGKLSQQLNI